MLTLTFLVKTVIDLYVMILLLRIWMQWARTDFYNPLSQFIVKVTQPIVGPLRRVIPSLGPIDSSSGYLVFWVIIIRSIMSWISQGRSPMDYVLLQLTEPLMAPVRRIIPAMGGLDFSAMVVILVLYMLNYLGMDLLGQLWFLL